MTATRTADSYADSPVEAPAAPPRSRVGLARRWKWVLAVCVAALVVGGISAAVVYATTSPSSAHEMHVTFPQTGDLTGPPWTIATGHWKQTDHVAFAWDTAPKWTLIAMDRGVSDGTVSVTVDARNAEAGMAFRVRDQENFWALTDAPRFGTWNLSKVVNGTVEFVTNTGLTRTRGSHQISVHLRGSFIDVAIDGHGAASVDDTELATASAAGLVVLGTYRTGTRPGARWADMDATVDQDGPRVAGSPSS